MLSQEISVCTCWTTNDTPPPPPHPTHTHTLWSPPLHLEFAICQIGDTSLLEHSSCAPKPSMYNFLLEDLDHAVGRVGCIQQFNRTSIIKVFAYMWPWFKEISSTNQAPAGSSLDPTLLPGLGYEIKARSGSKGSKSLPCYIVYAAVGISRSMFHNVFLATGRVRGYTLGPGKKLSLASVEDCSEAFLPCYDLC